MQAYAASMDAEVRARKRRVLETPTCRKQIRLSCSRLERGHQIMDAVREALRKIYAHVRLTSIQEDAVELVLASCTCFIYGDELQKNRVEIATRNGFDTEIKKGLLVDAPRRLGKSHIVKVVTAAIMMAVPNVVIVCVANSGLAAGAELGIIGGVEKLLVNIFGVSKFHRRNPKHLMFDVGPGDRRELHSFGAKSRDQYVVSVVQLRCSCGEFTFAA